MALKLTVTITGDDIGDLELALREVLRLVPGGCLSGGDENDTGSYYYEIEEEG